jgi:hypothetical protein
MRKRRKMNVESLLIDALVFRVRVANVEQMARFARVNQRTAARLLRKVEVSGEVERHHVWSVTPLPAATGPLYSWKPGEPEDLDRVREAARIGIRRWLGLKPTITRVWSASKETCRHLAVPYRLPRASEVAHDLFCSEVVSRLPDLTVFTKEDHCREHPLARELHADGVLNGAIFEAVGSYKVTHIVDFAKVCWQRACAVEMW